MSSLCEGPLVRVERWPDNTCTVGRTNFMVRLDPTGVAAVLDIDPQAYVLPRFMFANGIPEFGARFLGMPPAEWSDFCSTLKGYTQFYDCVTRNLEDARGYILDGAVNGFMFEVDVRKDSPLVGWFLVLGVNRE